MSRPPVVGVAIVLGFASWLLIGAVLLFVLGGPFATALAVVLTLLGASLVAATLRAP
ncbi:hypothetical protein ACH473_10525 [Cellulosimicrobium funkei]|uniref:hypothetical protein n=1 Tax=Cellulosimicrobium funkei TaxID=264251 RepID=UPI0037567B4A